MTIFYDERSDEAARKFTSHDIFLRQVITLRVIFVVMSCVNCSILTAVASNTCKCIFSPLCNQCCVLIYFQCSNSYAISRTVPFPVTLNDPLPGFQDHPIIWPKTRNGMRDTRETQLQCNTNRKLSFRITLSELAKYSMTRTIATAKLLVLFTVRIGFSSLP